MKKTLLGLFFAASFVTSQAQTGTALNFDGTNDNIRRNIVSTQTANCTMEARVAWTGSTAANQMIMYNGTNGTNGFGLYIAAGTNSVAIKYNAAVYTSSVTLTAGTPVLLSVVVYGPNGMALYVNGTMAQSFFPPPMITPTGTFSIGGDNTGALSFNGTFDEARFWNRALCNAELSLRSVCSPSGAEQLLVAFYNFNQGVSASNNSTVTTLMDLSPSNYTATLYNFALTGFTSNWVAAPGSFSTTCILAPNTLSITPTSSLALCAGNSATITVIGGSTYTWNTSATTSSIVITPSATTGYSVYGNIGPNCTGLAYKVVTVNPIPTLTLTSSQPGVLCIPLSATLTANGASTYSWNPGALTGSNVVVSPTVNTTYTINATSAAGCPGTSTITQLAQICSGLRSFSNSSEMTIYPNPTSGVFTLDLSNISNASKLEIYNAVGQLVLSNELNSYSTKVNLENMPKGIYIVRVKEGNTVIKTTKLIKE